MVTLLYLYTNSSQARLEKRVKNVNQIKINSIQLSLQSCILQIEEAEFSGNFCY